MSLGRKKVIVRKFNREWQAGYLPSSNFAHNGKAEILDLSGKVAEIILAEVKWLCYVRDFNSGETGNPERLLRKSFAGRPRSEGLWLRLRLTDGDTLEGLAANDLSLVDSQGLFLIPPDVRSNTQRVFVPRSSMTELEVVAVITSPSRRKATIPQEAAPPRQKDLFAASE